MTRRVVRSRRSRLLALSAASGLVLALSACGGDTGPEGEGDSGPDNGEAVDTVDDGESGDGAASAGYVEPEYDGLPADLTADEVCALLDEATVAEHLDAEVNKVTPGTRQPDCQWYYKLPGGPATNLQVQVMSMEQTGERLGTEALQWGLSRAPADVEVGEVATLAAPNGSYEYHSSSVVFAIDPVGRLFTVSAHSETSEEGRLALVEEVLASLTADHS